MKLQDYNKENTSLQNDFEVKVKTSIILFRPILKQNGYKAVQDSFIPTHVYASEWNENVAFFDNKKTKTKQRLD